MDEVADPFEEFLTILHELTDAQCSRLDQGWNMSVKEADFVRGWHLGVKQLEGIDYMKHINETIPRTHQGARYALASLFMAMMLKDSLPLSSCTALTQPWHYAWTSASPLSR
jgi:hypothetical protein